MASWDKRPKETNRAYAAFREYMTMGVFRRLSEVARRVGSPQPVVETWSSRNDWNERISDYEQFLMDTYIANAVNLMEINQKQIIDDSINDYDELLSIWRTYFSENRDAMTPDSMVKLITARRGIDDMGRRAVGLPNVNKDNTEQAKASPNTKRTLAWISGTAKKALPSDV